MSSLHDYILFSVFLIASSLLLTLFSAWLIASLSVATSYFPLSNSALVIGCFLTIFATCSVLCLIFSFFSRCILTLSLSSAILASFWFCTYLFYSIWSETSLRPSVRRNFSWFKGAMSGIEFSLWRISFETMFIFSYFSRIKSSCSESLDWTT